jgi:CubicO group peptidase (beta-lactamase class C family)
MIKDAPNRSILRRTAAFFLPFAFLFLCLSFHFKKEIKANRIYQAGHRWVSGVLGIPAGDEDAPRIFRAATGDLYASENVIWQLLFPGREISATPIPYRPDYLVAAASRNKAPRASVLQRLPIPALTQEITDPRLLALEYARHEEALTVLQNKGGLIPFRDLDTLSFASVAIGSTRDNTFQEYLGKYSRFRHFTVPRKDDQGAYDGLLGKLKEYKVVVVSLHDLSDSPLQAYGIPQSARTFIERLRSRTRVALVVFGTPYSLKYFDRADYLVCAYEDNRVTQQLVPQLLFGAIPAVGKLPVTVTASLKAGSGLPTASLRRLGYTVPERAGLQSATLARIDRVMENCIRDSVMPGGQVLVAKKGKVVFEKAYGHQTYDRDRRVTTSTLYDLASVTKVAATLQAVMSLQAQGRIDLHRRASDYLPELRNTNKEDILIQDLLLHQAGLIAFQDHWTRTRTESSLDSAFFSGAPDEQHPLEVAPGIYGIATLKDSLWHWTIQSQLLTKPRKQKKYAFKYSDVGFGILQQVVERVANQPLDAYLNTTFYGPLGLDELTFNPLRRFSESRIAPTELDNQFRGMLVRGTVHDQEAALMGGVAGHAGLFGTANDLAVLMQMNLQKGYYGGKQYLGENTIPFFTRTYQENNPRGLGWDRPLPKTGSNVSELASRNSFGHTGFTGTCVWVDPDQELVYIFLSNRVYPDVNNTKLARYRVRQKIQTVVYEAMSPAGALVAGIE